MNLLSKSRRSGLHADLVVLVADCGERLKVRIHKQNMSALNIHQSRGGILNLRVARPHALNVEKPLIEQFGR